MPPRIPSKSSAAVVAAAASLLLPALALADDPVCAVRTATAPVLFQGNGPVDFGPGFMGTLGGSMFGLQYNLLLQGDYDWAMPGTLHARWPPSMMVSAEGTPNAGRLTVQYGLRLQATLLVFGSPFPLPLPDWVGMADRSERGMSMFTPWAWTGTDTAVTVTATERLLREGDLNVPVLGALHWRVYASYQLTTTVRTDAISFPQAMSSITAMAPEAQVAPTANGDVELPAQWNGVLRYVGSVRLRVQVDYNTCVGPICVPAHTDVVNQAIPFASAMEQHMSVDRSVHLTLPGATSMPGYAVDFGRVALGLQGRQIVTLQNPGRVTTLFTPGAPSDPAFVVPTDPLCVAGGSSRTLSVRFTPPHTGPFAADMIVNTSAPSVPQIQLHFTGEGYDPSAPRDAAAPTDATTPSDAASTSDAGSTTADAAIADDAGADLHVVAPDGCACHASPPSRRGASLASAAAVLAFAVRRRRRRSTRR